MKTFSRWNSRMKSTSSCWICLLVESPVLLWLSPNKLSEYVGWRSIVTVGGMGVFVVKKCQT